MKKGGLLILLGVFLLVGCQPANDETKANKLSVNVPAHLPTSVAEMKHLLSEVKVSQKKLETFVEKLETRIGELDSTEVKAMSVTAIIAKKQDYRHYVEIQANVQAEDPVMASGENGGRLISMTWKEGQFINKGDVVARVDLEQMDRTLNRQIAELRTRLELARTVFQRQERLWKQNIGSEIQYLQAKNNVESLEKSIATVQSQKREAVVYAPASGTIDRVMLRQGEMASPGSPILMIVDMSTMKVVAGVPERYLKNVKIGERVKIEFPSLEEEKTARVNEIGRMINPANRTFEVEVKLPNPKRLLKPNLQSVMYINDKTIEDVVMIPEELLRQDVGGNSYVFVVKEQDENFNVATKQVVQTGVSAEGMVVIKEGLQGDEIIVAKGGRGLSAGQRVEVEIVSPQGNTNNG